MVKSNSDRQREYREQALKDPDGLILTSLQVMLSAGANGSLDRLIAATGKTKREVVELALRVAGEIRYTVTIS